MLAASAYRQNTSWQIRFTALMSGIVWLVYGQIAAISLFMGAGSVIVAGLVYFAVAFKGATISWLKEPVSRLIYAAGAKVLTLMIVAGLSLTQVEAVQAGYFIFGFIACVVLGSVLGARAIATVTD